MNLSFLDAECMNIHKLIAVYCNTKATDLFLAGYPLAFDKDFLLLALLAPDGCTDGICICNTSTIYRIEVESAYLRKLKPHPCVSEIDMRQYSVWDTFLHYAENNRLIVQSRDFSGKQVDLGIPLQHSGKMFVAQRIINSKNQGEVYRINKSEAALLSCDSEKESLLRDKNWGSGGNS